MRPLLRVPVLLENACVTVVLHALEYVVVLVGQEVHQGSRDVRRPSADRPYLCLRTECPKWLVVISAEKISVESQFQSRVSDFFKKV